MIDPISKKTHVCPWWLGYTMDNPIRRIMHPPKKLLAQYVSEGMCVMDFGCGFGHYSIGMAQMVGAKGKVVSVDVQQKMLDKVRKRALRMGLDNIIDTHLCSGTSIGVCTQFDFILMCNSLHETPTPQATLAEVFTLLKQEGKLLVLEPKFHNVEIADEIQMAESAGFTYIESPSFAIQQSALFQKQE